MPKPKNSTAQLGRTQGFYLSFAALAKLKDLATDAGRSQSWIINDMILHHHNGRSSPESSEK